MSLSRIQNRSYVTALAVGIFTLVTALVAHARRAEALDIHLVQVELLFSHADGLPSTPNPYELELVACGSGLLGVTGTPPAGDPVTLVPDPDDPGCWYSGEDNPVFSTAQVGDYLFSFTGESANDTASLPFDVTEPGGVAQITSPAHGATDVALEPVFRWTSVDGSGSGIEAIVVGPPPMFEEFPYAVLSITATSWDPWDPSDPNGPTDGLEPGVDYDFELDVFNELETAVASSSSDSFTYRRTFIYRNRIHFQTALGTHTAQVDADIELDKRPNAIPADLGDDLCSFWLGCQEATPAMCDQLSSALRGGCEYFYVASSWLESDVDVVAAALTTPTGQQYPLSGDPRDLGTEDFIFPCFDDLAAAFPPGTYTVDIVYADPSQEPKVLELLIPTYGPDSFPDPAHLGIVDVAPLTVEWEPVAGATEYELGASCDPGLCPVSSPHFFFPPDVPHREEAPWDLTVGGACLVEIRDQDHLNDPTDLQLNTLHFAVLDERDGDGIPSYEGPRPCGTGEFAGCADNCPRVSNAGQTDTDGNGIGDVCQCGDVNGDGVTNVTDALSIARGGVLSSNPNFAKCDVNGDGVCNVTDALQIARGEVGSTPAEQLCPAYTGESPPGA
jgi:hypothetical protein